MFRIRISSCLALILLSAALPAWTASNDEPDDARVERQVEAWLLLEGAPSSVTAFASEDDALSPLALEGFGPNAISPHAGEPAGRVWSSSATWRHVATRDGRLDLGGQVRDHGLAHLVTYVTTTSFLNAKISVHSDHPYLVRVDGEEVLRRNAGDDDPSKADLPLETGTHQLSITAGRDSDAAKDWTLSLTISASAEEASSLDALTISTDPRRSLALEDILETPRVVSSLISSDGSLAALTLKSPPVPSPSSRRWIEIVDVNTGAILRTLRSKEIRSFAWSPMDDRYAYVLSEDEVSSLVIGSWKDGKERVLIDRYEDLGPFRWSADGKSLLFFVQEKDQADTPFAKRFRALPDRWADWRTKHSLFQVSTEDGSWRRLSADAQGVSIASLRRDGSKILLAQALSDDQRWPFARVKLLELDLRTLESRTLSEIPWSADARYSPDGSRILVLSSPLAFGRQGVRGDNDEKPNLYDTQAYLLDSTTGEAEVISLNFDPNIVDARWSRNGASIYVLAEEASFVRLFRYDLQTRNFESMPTKVDVIESFDLAGNAARLLYRGSSVDRPQEVHALDLNDGSRSTELFRRGKDSMAEITMAKVVDWNFVSNAGVSIPGRFYLPPGFDPKREKKWPLIVYYYGGTSPSRRVFAGRYPQQYWAAQGYVVYVLQPSGATGFGQAVSSRHVNNWGRTVADEIIEGTRHFLQTHAFVDESRVGAIGASYGGFMTMLLLTKTDIFAAAVSHAGISSLASYWGEGWWGYLYSAAASTNSYPWNAPELYIEQSPLFHADKITTPLLLLHGSADTNVPPGQSDLIYTALRVLGREVEYVQIADENHWILEHEKRRFWAETIVAWFDRNLKNEPAFWKYLYPDD